jgi:hypothetical protein
MELEAEVQKLKEQNAELQKKQVYTMLYNFCTVKSIFCHLTERDSDHICMPGSMLIAAVLSQILVK